MARSSSGIGFFGLLWLMIIYLKFTGYITWSWTWITAPFWGGACVALLGVIILTVQQARKK